jgi:hypothetical protein
VWQAGILLAQALVCSGESCCSARKVQQQLLLLHLQLVLG